MAAKVPMATKVYKGNLVPMAAKVTMATYLVPIATKSTVGTKSTNRKKCNSRGFGFI